MYYLHYIKIILQLIITNASNHHCMPVFVYWSVDVANVAHTLLIYNGESLNLSIVIGTISCEDYMTIIDLNILYHYIFIINSIR